MSGDAGPTRSDSCPSPQKAGPSLSAGTGCCVLFCVMAVENMLLLQRELSIGCTDVGPTQPTRSSKEPKNIGACRFTRYKNCLYSLALCRKILSSGAAVEAETDPWAPQERRIEADGKISWPYRWVRAARTLHFGSEPPGFEGACQPVGAFSSPLPLGGSGTSFSDGPGPLGGEADSGFSCFEMV